MNLPAQRLKVPAKARITRAAAVAYIRATWKPVFIGNLMRIDVMGIAFGLGFDIILCGIVGAFSLLTAAAALALPPETRAMIWIGCAFALIAAVDRPSFKPLLGLPLVLLIVLVGAVTLSAPAAHLPPEWVAYFALSQGVLIGGTMALVILAGISTAGQIVKAFAWAFRDEPVTREQRILRWQYQDILKSALGYKPSYWKTRADGTFVFTVSHRQVKDISVDTLSQWCACPVEFVPRRNVLSDDRLIVHPPRKEAAYVLAQTP